MVVNTVLIMVVPPFWLTSARTKTLCYDSVPDTFINYQTSRKLPVVHSGDALACIVTPLEG